MHDIDRAMFEMQQEQEQEAGGNHEFPGELTQEWESHETGGSQEMHETQEMELAAELLEVTNEAELEQFLGNLLGRVVSAGRSFVNSDAGRAVGGLLKSAAKQVLPTVGQAVGNWVSPGAGGRLGSQAATWLADKLELEGLSQEDREFETARAFVRFADETARCAAAAPTSVAPGQVAVRAATTAAQRQLPALVPVIARLTPPGASLARGPRAAATGTWVRRGSTIVLLNA